jgi:hypothetical protein
MRQSHVGLGQMIVHNFVIEEIAGSGQG